MYTQKNLSDKRNDMYLACQAFKSEKEANNNLLEEKDTTVEREITGLKKQVAEIKDLVMYSVLQKATKEQKDSIKEAEDKKERVNTMKQWLKRETRSKAKLQAIQEGEEESDESEDD